MFGLLQYRGRRGGEWDRWRLHYCGTCKTLGRVYGQASRLTLNHDTVYLAETLSEIGAFERWDAPFRSFNCMSLPRESPAHLRFAAAATVLLAAYKLRDRVQDSRRYARWWRMVTRWWDPRFRKAVAELRELGFDAAVVDCALSRQLEVEARGASLEEFAGPTMAAVSAFFGHGAELAKRPEMRETLAAMGSRLGFLVYVLDAFEDEAKDRAAGSFNALAALRMSRAEAVAAIDAAVSEAVALYPPIGVRLRANLGPRLGRTLLPVLCEGGSKRMSWSAAWDRAEELAEGRAWPVLAAVAVSVFLFPQHSRAAGSAGECLSLGANLMALGSLVAVAVGRGKKKAAEGSGAGVCDGCECCAEGCCECVECGSCCECVECGGGCCECVECGSCCDC